MGARLKVRTISRHASWESLLSDVEVVNFNRFCGALFSCFVFLLNWECETRKTKTRNSKLEMRNAKCECLLLCYFPERAGLKTGHYNGPWGRAIILGL